MLESIIDQTENFQINNTEELVHQLIHELDHYQLPRCKQNN
ncbi:hypothetical protein [Aquibacillus koreensis]|nr:hypothetical protein [Aquibacillus koreensis]